MHGEMSRFIMNVGCIALCMFLSHELVFHSLSLCDHDRQADNEPTGRPDIMRGGVFDSEKNVYF